LFRKRSYIPLLLYAVATLVVFLDSEALFHPPDLLWSAICLVISLSGLVVRIMVTGTVPAGTSGRNTKGQLARTLNTRGIYSVVRHPLYLGNFLMWLGLILYVGHIWFWLVAILLMLVATRWWVGRQLTPLHRLEQQIDEVGAGTRHQLAISSNLTELTQVSNAFNNLENERREALNHLRDRQTFLDAVLGSTPTGMFIADLEGQISYLNPALESLLGLPEKDPTSVIWERIHQEDRQGALDLWRHTLAHGSDFVRQLRVHDAQGELLWVEVHASQVQGSDKPLGIVGTVKDITERRHQEALQRWEAEHDPLTGLLNRRGFERRLEEALADFTKIGTPSALVLFDLDHFKPVNDEGGHALGDELLRRVAAVVTRETRRSDHLARQGGDEFGLLMPSCTLRQAEMIAESIRTAIGQASVRHAGKEYFVTASLGLTSFRPGDDAVATVLDRADAASYDAKRQGRNAIMVDGDATAPSSCGTEG